MSAAGGAAAPDAGPTYLVTGGNGFVGSALVRHLVRHSDARVVNLDALTYAGTLGSVAEVAASPRYAHERVDLRDRDAVHGVVRRHRPEAVFHLAAETHVDRSIDGPAAFVETNVLGTLHLLEAARALLDLLPPARAERFRFVHVSTDEVFGSLAETEEAFSEDTPYAPRSPYAASKAGGDHLVRAWHHTWNLPVLLTHCSNNHGPFQFPEKFIPHMVLSALEGRELPVYGDGGHVRDWIHVDDHVRALLRVLEAGRVGERYLIGADAERRNLEVVEQICRILDDLRPRPDGASHRERIRLVPDRPGHDRRYAVDAGRMRRELDWVPEQSFESALRRTVAWYLDREDWWKPLREERYRGERLGAPS